MVSAELAHVFCLLMAISRGLDFFSTWLVTPKLTLEANLAMKRRKWSTLLLLNLPLLGVPYVHLGFSLTMIILSFLVAGNTLSNAALTRGLGEKKHLQSIKKAVQGNSLFKAVSMNSLGAFSVIAGGGLLMRLAENPWHDLSWWGALGVVCYGLTALVHVNLNLIRLFRKTAKQPSHFTRSEESENNVAFNDFAIQSVQLRLSKAHYEQIQAKAQLFGKSVEEFCQMVILESKAKVK